VFVKFHLFRKSLGCDLYHFSELLDFSKSCLPESSAMRNFNKVEFNDAISAKSTSVKPRSEIVKTKPPYVCPGCFIHTYSNNMINRFHVQ
jgi:hypothetical protein